MLNEGAVAYYLANGDLVFRFVDISFFAVSPGGQLQFQPLGPLEPEGPVVLEDPAAANHGRRVVWWVSEQFSTGFNISDGAPPFCFIIIGFLCHIVTPFEAEQGTERPLRGSIQIRAHGVGEDGGGAQELRVTCQPAEVERGQPVTCAATVEPSTAELEVQRWQFVGGGFEREFLRPDTAWSGPAVVGGTVTVEAIVDGETAFASASFTVIPRDWAGLAVPADVREVEATLPANPDSLKDLGQIDQGVFVDASPHLAPITEGPNLAIFYWETMPVGYEAEIQVNRAALQAGSAFWRAQRQTGPAFAVAQPCLRRDVEPFIEGVLQHEGIDLNERSHAGLYHREVERRAGPLVEGLTADGGQELMDATMDELKPMSDAASAESGRADTEFAPRYCRFNFDYRPPRN